MTPDEALEPTPSAGRWVVRHPRFCDRGLADNPIVVETYRDVEFAREHADHVRRIAQPAHRDFRVSVAWDANATDADRR